MFRIILPLCVLLAAVAAYLAYAFGKESAVADLIAASRKDDVEAFAARVHWEDLREFLKKDLAAQKKGPLGSSFGPDATQIGKIVDYYVQPENIDIAFYYHDELFAGVPEEDFIHTTGFSPPFGFSVTVGFPKSAAANDNASAAARDRLKARFVFRLDGLTWKIKEMHVPLFMVPRHVYSTPAVQVYGRPRR